MTDNQIKIADAGAAGWIGYAVASWMAWASLCGYVNEHALIYMAATALACTIPYMGAGITQLKLGDRAGGVTWIYFGSFFAFGSAIKYAVDYFAMYNGWILDGRIFGFQWAILAAVLILTTPIFMKFAPLAAGLSIIAVDIGLVSLALISWNINVATLGGWAFFVAGFLAIFIAAGDILEGAGLNFPLGKPMLK